MRASPESVTNSVTKIDIDIEVLLFELLERTVLMHLRQRLVEHRFQLDVILAQADGRAFTDCLWVFYFRAGPGEAFTARRLQEPGVGLQFVLQRGVETPEATSAYT